MCAEAITAALHHHVYMLARPLSQLLFLSGVMLIIGPSKTYRFFFQKRKAKGTACFLGGICLVLYGWAMVGILVEGWGFINLFADFFPTALCAAHRSQDPRHARAEHERLPPALTVCMTAMRDCVRSGFLRNMPIIGTVLSLPPVRALTDRLVMKSRLPV